MKKKIILSLLVCIVVSYFGRIEKEIIDELEVATAVGFDSKGKKKIEATAVIPLIKPDKTISNKTISSIGNLSKEALSNVNHKSYKPVVNGKLEVVLYSKKVAELGIQDYIDTFHRDPSVGSRLLLTVVDGEVKEMLQKKFEEFDTGSYIQRQLNHNMERGLIPTSNLHLFLSSYYTKGIDPVLPLLELEGDKINIKGLALFKGTKMVDSIPYRNMFVFKSLYENIKMAGYKLKTKEKGKTEYFSIQGISSRKEFNVRHIHTAPEVTLHLKIKGYIREYTGEGVSAKTAEKAEKLMENKVNEEAEMLIKKFQRKNIDPLAFGEQARSRTRYWDEKKWVQQYKNMKVDVKVDVMISEIGVVDGLEL